MTASRSSPRNAIVGLAASHAGPSDGLAREKAIHAAILDAVMEHRLPPGTKLTESAFSAHFGISRATIRKVLFRLAQRNVVELRPNRGAIVARPSVEETRMVFDARRLIEKEIIAIVAARRTREHVRLLRAALRDEQNVQSAGERHRLLRLSGAFHVRLAEFTGNTILASVVGDLVSRTSLIIALYEAHGSVACRSNDHALLVELIEKRDAERAARALVQHLNAIEGRLNLNKPASQIDLREVFGAARA